MAKKQQEEILETVENAGNNQVQSGKGMLFSRLDYAEQYTYNGETCMITPKGKIKVDDIAKVGKPLAKGLLLRKID